MPIYEYHCTDCDRSFEALVAAGWNETECRFCHGGNLTREMSVFASARGSDSNGIATAFNGGGGQSMGGGGCCGGGCGCH